MGMWEVKSGEKKGQEAVPMAPVAPGDKVDTQAQDPVFRLQSGPAAHCHQQMV